MSVQDFIKKSILQSDNYATQSPFRIVIVLLLALLIGAFIYKVYQHFDKSHQTTYRRTLPTVGAL